MTLTELTALAAITATGLTGAQPDVEEQLVRAGYIVVALRESGVGHLHADGLLAGERVEVLVDTGASNTVIDIDVARRLGLRLTPSNRSGAGIGDAVAAIMNVEGADFRVNGLAVPGAIYAMDFTNLRQALAARSSAVPAVVLGGDAMRAMDAVLAYRQNRLFLRPSGRPQP